jgi:hypothetical protein
LKSRWSTPEATAREFGLSSTELGRIVETVRKFLAGYRRPPTSDEDKPARKIVHHSRRRARAR